MNKFYRLNGNIQAKEIRLLDEQNKQMGIFTRDEALAKARSLGVDLVEIAPKALPPVCKVIDFKKFKYQESKRDREIRKKAKAVELKQLRLRPFIGEHDLNVRLHRAEEFLKEGNRIKVIVQFSGREITHKEFGFKLINTLVDRLADFGAKEREPKFEGRMLVVYISPGKGTRHAENQDQKSSTQAVQSNQDGQNIAPKSNVTTPQSG